MAKQDTYQYPGKKIDVAWDGRLCIHIGECGRAKGELFVTGRQPWCQPELVSEEEIVDVVKRCPTGALTYRYKDGEGEERAVRENTVVVSCNGPLFIQGDLDIDGATADMSSVRFRAALCRCGESKNKPFCDNSHKVSGFSDYGAVGEQGNGMASAGGRLNIKRLPNGPLLLSGNFSITAGSGRVAWHGSNAALCRCGHSENKPFCDGKHRAAGFFAD